METKAEYDVNTGAIEKLPPAPPAPPTIKPPTVATLTLERLGSNYKTAHSGYIDIGKAGKPGEVSYFNGLYDFILHGVNHAGRDEHQFGVSVFSGDASDGWIRGKPPCKGASLFGAFTPGVVMV